VIVRGQKPLRAPGDVYIRAADQKKRRDSTLDKVVVIRAVEHLFSRRVRHNLNAESGGDTFDYPIQVGLVEVEIENECQLAPDVSADAVVIDSRPLFPKATWGVATSVLIPNQHTLRPSTH